MSDLARTILDPATGVALLVGPDNPQVAGADAPINSLYLTGGATWQKFGAGLTQWSQFAASAGFLPLSGGSLNAGASLTVPGTLTTGPLLSTGHIRTAQSGDFFVARWSAGTDNYAAALGWNPVAGGVLQLGNSGANEIRGGGPGGAGGSLRFVVNNTAPFDQSTDGTRALTLSSAGGADFTARPTVAGVGLLLPGDAPAFGAGTTVTNSLNLIGAAGSYREIIFTGGAGSAPRWDLYVDPTAESGANAGSNFNLARYSDAGAYLGSPLSIRRSDGTLFLEQRPYVGATGLALQGESWTTAQADARYAQLGHTHTFASLTAKPTTIAGFGISDAITRVVGRNETLDADAVIGTDSVHSAGGTPSHLPESYGNLLQFTNSDVNTQLYLSYGGNMYWRRAPGSSLAGVLWRTVLDAFNYGSFALPLSGGTLTGGLVGTTIQATAWLMSSSGYVHLNAAGTRYLQWDGTRYVLPSARLDVGGDITGVDLHASRGDGTGVVYLHSGTSRYVYYDGTKYRMPGANLVLDGALELAGGVQASGNSTFGGSVQAGAVSSPSYYDSAAGAYLRGVLVSTSPMSGSAVGYAEGTVHYTVV